MKGNKIRIGIIAGTAYPSSPEFYGSEVEMGILANELGKLENEVILIAATKSMKGNYELKLLPCTWGRLNYDIEYLVMQYADILYSCDYVIDASPLNIFSEETYFWKRNWLKNHVLVYYRNGTSSFNPRPPVNYKVHGVWLSNSAIEAMQPFKLPRELCHAINNGIPEWYKPIENPTKDYILYLGACRPEKGIYTILEIAKKLPNEKFVFAWRAIHEEHKREQEKFLEKAKELQNVEFKELPEKGHFKAKLRLMQNAKAFIQINNPNYVEAQGLARLEACRCGCPLIVEDSKSAREFLNDKVAFFCKNIEDAVNAIDNIDKIDRKECYEFVKEKYSVERFAEEYLDLYDKIKR
jgi:glycosyltransferase involved in cell wall biosynthesis